MKRFQLLLWGLLVILMIQGCGRHQADRPGISKPANELIPSTKYGADMDQANLLAKYVANHLVGSKGIASQNSVAGQPQVMFSESAGLWLIYQAQSGHYAQFRQIYRQTVTQFETDGLLMYQVQLGLGTRSKVNATLDDLRVIRSLGLYAAKRHSQRYFSEAVKRFTALKQKVGRKGQLRDFYDTRSHQVSNLTSLAYYELLTLKTFENQSDYQRQLKLVQRGYLNSQLPLYAANYDWQRHQYSKKALNTSEALLTLLHLAEVHQLPATSLRWLTHQVTSGTLYNRYRINGEVADWSESPANYAIAARIFAAVREPRLYRLAMNQVWRFQIKRSGSPLKGALGDDNQNLSYAFNDLQALISSGY